MKVLRLSSYCYPEQVASSHLANDLNEAFEKAGITSVVYAPTPTRGIDEETRKKYKKIKYEETNNGYVQIHRFAMFKEPKNSLLRAFRYTLCIIRQFFNALCAKDIDVYYASSTPPINGLMFPFIKAFKKYKIVYNLQDIFPDSLVNTGMTKKGSILWKIGKVVENITYKYVDRINVISENMKENIMRKGVPEEKIKVIYNWIDTDLTKHIRREKNKIFDELNLDRNKFYVTYAGNIGNSQNVELLVECAKKTKDNNDIEFVIFGAGSEKNKLEKLIKDSGLANIKMFPVQPVERVSEVYSISDVSFVLCKKGVGGSGFPSKAATIMATETAVIASFDGDSELCRVVNEGQAGICVEPENVEQATDAINKLFDDRKLLKKLGENGRKLAEEKFSKEKSVGEKIKVLKEVGLK